MAVRRVDDTRIIIAVAVNDQVRRAGPTASFQFLERTPFTGLLAALALSRLPIDWAAPRNSFFGEVQTLCRKVRSLHRPQMPVRFEAGNLWRRKRRVGEGADCDPDEVRCGGNVPVNGRTAHRAEVIRGPPAVTGGIRDPLPAVAGKRPLRRFAFYLHLPTWKPPLHGEHGARPQLARVAAHSCHPR